jgi:hypothetical protein
MTRLDMVRVAVAELGDQATAAQVAGFVAERFGQDLGVGFVPIYRATLRAEDQLREARERAAALVAEDRAARSPAARPGRG